MWDRSKATTTGCIGFSLNLQMSLGLAINIVGVNRSDSRGAPLKPVVVMEESDVK